MSPPLSSEQLWAACRKLPEDYAPYGQETTDGYEPQCSCGCRWYHQLQGAVGADWGICGNPRSHRCGLLTFEHQGCRKYESLPCRKGGKGRKRP